MNKSKSGGVDALPMVSPDAAAIDIGSTMHMAAVNPDVDDRPVRAFGTFTGDLHDMARWFKACGVTSVAMESRSLASQRFDEKLVIEVIGELERIVLIAGACAAIDVTVGAGDLDPAEPCGLPVVCSLVEIDHAIAERLALGDHPFGGIRATFSALSN